MQVTVPARETFGLIMSGSRSCHVITAARHSGEKKKTLVWAMAPMLQCHKHGCGALLTHTVLPGHSINDTRRTSEVIITEKKIQTDETITDAFNP